MSVHLQRAQLLFSQSRFEMAEAELRQALADQPQNARIRALLAECLQLRSKPPEALAEARAAIQLAPDDPYPHYVHARVLFKQDKNLPARKAVEEAIRLDPEQADYFGLLSAIALEQDKPAEALEAAERGLSIDAEGSQCLNMRAMALVKLGRKKEAGATMQGALAKDPENAVTHANQGWTYLHRNDPRKALEHFREALRLEPGMEWARNGLLQAMRARYLIYRMILAYYLWMARLGARTRVAILIGGFIASRIARGVAKANEDAAPVMWTIFGLYCGFVFLTWTAEPLFNLLLQLNRFGRYALKPAERVASYFVGTALLLALGWLAAAIVWERPEFFLIAAGFGMLVMIIGGVSAATGFKRERVIVAVFAATALVAAIAFFFLGMETPAWIAAAAFGLSATIFLWAVGLHSARS